MSHTQSHPAAQSQSQSHSQSHSQSSRRGGQQQAHAKYQAQKDQQGQVVQERTTRGSSASAPRVVHFVVGESLALIVALWSNQRVGHSLVSHVPDVPRDKG